MFSESSLTCGLRSDEDDVKTGCKNVKLFFVEPLVRQILFELVHSGIMSEAKTVNEKAQRTQGCGVVLRLRLIIIMLLFHFNPAFRNRSR